MKLELTVGVIALFVQFAGLLWAAGRFSASVDQLNKTTLRLDATLNNVINKVNSLETTVAIVAERVKVLQDEE